MKGLELSHKYFMTYGEQMIKDKFYSHRNRIAAGMAGEGSECLGFDDVISRDHDWGPGFCLWLTDGDFNKIGIPLQEEYEKLPRAFMGFGRKTAALSDKKVGVFRITDFYTRFTGLPHVPEDNAQWLHLSDEYLCACTSGTVFCDPLGKFSDIRNTLLDFYPEDVRLFKIAARCLTCAQSGQYNFMRLIKRGELFAASYALNKFCSDIISVVFLLNKKFVPFYKWKHRAVKELGSLGSQIYDDITQLLSVNDNMGKKSTIIENMSVRIITEIKSQGMSDVVSDFLLDHGYAIQQTITDKDLRERSAWGG